MISVPAAGYGDGRFLRACRFIYFIMEISKQERSLFCMQDSLRNCRVCGKLYMHISGPQLCQSCREELEDIYFRAREEIRNAPPGKGFDKLEISEKLGVDPVYIQIMVEEGLFDQEIDSGERISRAELADQFAAELDKMRKHGSSRSGSAMHVDKRYGRRNR